MSVIDAADSAEDRRRSVEQMSPSGHGSQTPDRRPLTLRWGALDDLPLLFANQLLSQARPQDGMLYITFGQATPPPFVGSADAVREQVDAVESLEIKPLFRLAITPDTLREFIRVLRGNLDKYEQGLARLESIKREAADGG
jgi:hypothetical protein